MARFHTRVTAKNRYTASAAGSLFERFVHGLHLGDARYLKDGLELCERTSRAHSSIVLLCAPEGHTHSSKPFSRYRVPRFKKCRILYEPPSHNEPAVPVRYPTG